jgi:hypothetical protein
MKRRLLYILLPFFFVSCFVVIPDSLDAQGYQSFRQQFTLIEETTRWQIGPFRLFPELRFTNIGYDNNVYYLPEALDPIGDYTFTTSLPLTINLLLRERWILTFNVTPEYVFFFEQTRERSFNYSYAPAFRWQIFSRFVLSGEYLYRKRRARANSEFDDRVLETRQEAKGQFFYETGRRTSLGVTGTFRQIRYEDVEGILQDTRYSVQLNRDEIITQGEVYYQIWSDSQFFISGSFTDHTFVHPDTKWKDSYGYSLFTGIQFPLLGRIRGTLSLGYKILDPYRAKKKGFSGFVGNTRLEYRLRRFVFRGSYERDTEFSYWTENIFYIEDRYGLGASFYLNQYIRLDYDFFYGDSFYPEAETIRLPDESYVEINRSDQYKRHIAGLVVRIFRNVGIGIRVTFWQRESNFAFQNRTQGIIGGYLTYTF